MRFMKFMAFTATLPFCLTALPSMALPVCAEEDSGLPGWIPTDAVSAFSFVEQHGKTYVADDLICCVREIPVQDKNYYHYETSLACSSDTAVDAVRILSQEVYTYGAEEYYKNSGYPGEDDPENPDVILMNPEEQFQEFMKTDYVVSVYQLEDQAECSVTWSRSNAETGYVYEETEFTFEKSGGVTQETDLYGWIPDCMAEYGTFRRKYGTVSQHDNLVVYCNSVCYDGGYDVFLEQSGTTEFKEIYHDSIGYPNPVLLPPGGMGTVVIVYEPLAPGEVRLTWNDAQPWIYEQSAICQAQEYFRISAGDDGVSVKTIQAGEFTEPVRNDINSDGSFDILDIIVLQKWLLGKGTLANWRNADYQTDGVINIYDLLLMKQELLKSLKSESSGSEQELSYSLLEQTCIRNGSRMQDMQEQIHLARSFEEFRQIIQDYELCQYENCNCPSHAVENLIPEELTQEEYFTDHAIVVLYSSAGSGDRQITVDKVTQNGQTLTVSTTTTHQEFPTPDMAYFRTILVLDDTDSLRSVDSEKVTQENLDVYCDYDD